MKEAPLEVMLECLCCGVHERRVIDDASVADQQRCTARVETEHRVGTIRKRVGDACGGSMMRSLGLWIAVLLCGCMESTGRQPDVYACTAHLFCGNETSSLELAGATCGDEPDTYDVTRDSCDEFGALECQRSRYWRCEVSCLAMSEADVTACQ